MAAMMYSLCQFSRARLESNRHGIIVQRFDSLAKNVPSRRLVALND
jgi:hypothetical protein